MFDSEVINDYFLFETNTIENKDSKMSEVIDRYHPLSIQNKEYPFYYSGGVTETMKFNSPLQLFVYLKANFFGDLEIIPNIFQVNSSKDLLYLSHKIKNFSEPVWKLNRNRIMKEAVKQWVFQNNALKELLIRIVCRIPDSVKSIQYASGNDSYWSICGKNALGKLYSFLYNDLMKILRTKTMNPKALSWEIKSSEPSLNYFSPETDGDWDHFLGRRICAMLESTNVPKTGTIIEVGPGSVSKVGFALERFGFVGEIVLVEPEESALQTIVSSYKQMLNPEVKITEFLGTFDRLPIRKADLIIGNHVIDDIIAGKWLSKTGYAAEGFFEDHYDNPLPEVTAYIWENLAKDVSTRLCIFNEIREEFSRWSPDVWILSVYDSYYFRSNRNKYQSLHHANVLSRRLMDLIHSDFVSRGYKTLAPVEYVQSENYWKIYVKSS